MKTTYPSLRQYLDAVLPWRITIIFINFLSWFGFMKPVDSRITKLRILVNTSSNDTEYFYYYKNNDNEAFFKDVFNADLNFEYSEHEKAMEDYRKSSYDLDSKPHKEEEDYIEVTRTPRPKALDLNAAIQHIKQGQWDALSANLSKLAPTDQASLAQELLTLALEDNSKLPKISLDQGILQIFDQLYPTHDALKQALLDKTKPLPNQLKSLLCFLEIKGSWYKALLIQTVSKLGQCQNGDYAVSAEFIALNTTLRLFRQAPDVIQQDESIQKTTQYWAAWKQAHPAEAESEKEFVNRISSCLEQLDNVVKLFNSEPALRQQWAFNEQQKREELHLIDARHELAHRLGNGEQYCVSEQRLRELYPNEAEFNAKKFQYERMGVDVFDAKDPDANRRALQEAAYLKQLNLTGTVP